MADLLAAEPTWRDRLSARIAALSRTGGISPPEPDLRCIGSVARGRALMEGELHFGGSKLRATGDPPALWAARAPGPDFELGRHGFDWLEDLAAVGSPAARRLALIWTETWIAQCGSGGGAGWTPLAAARRVSRLIDLSPWLLAGTEPARHGRTVRATIRTARYLGARFRALPAGTARIETAAALAVAAVALPGQSGFLARATTELETLCRAAIDAQGGVPDRSPETLAQVLFALARAADALSGTGRASGPEHLKAMQRIAPTLRALRHADGQLCRFQGGNAGDVMRIDAALAMAGVSGLRARGLAMGFARLARGRTTVLVDAAAPSLGPEHGRAAHASTLAFEMTSGRRPVIVSCGAGSGFGPDWHRAARATPSHSTLAIDGRSSARLGSGRGDGDIMVEGPSDVQVDTASDRGGLSLVAGHNGYADSYGLIHVRRLDLDPSGRRLTGEDVLTAVTETERRRFETALVASRSTRQIGRGGLEFALRFHLDPAISAVLDRNARRVRLSLPGGETWDFRHRGDCQIRLDPSVYLENTRPAPVGCQQIVLIGRASRLVTQVDWLIEKSAATQDFLRDAGQIQDAEGPGTTDAMISETTPQMPPETTPGVPPETAPGRALGTTPHMAPEHTSPGDPAATSGAGPDRQQDLVQPPRQYPGPNPVSGPVSGPEYAPDTGPEHATGARKDPQT